MSKDIKKLLADIQALAIEVTAKTKHDVFVRYSAHINTINVEVNYGGWSTNTCSEVILNLSLTWEDKKLKKLKDCKRTLKKLLKEV